MNDVLAIGDGPAAARELAALLKATGPSAVATGPMHATLSQGTLPNTSEINVVAAGVPDSAPAGKQSLDLRPVLDANGQIDCSRAVSCQTDPATNVTTVTFSDGVVAVVQKVNDLTLVAYKTVGDLFGALLPQGAPSLPAAAAPPPPAPTPVPTPLPDPVPEVTAGPVGAPEVLVKGALPAVDPGPVAPSAPAAPEITAADIRPRLTITTPPQDFSPAPGGPGPIPGLEKSSGALNTVADTVKGAIGSVVDAVGKAINPGASEKESSGGKSGD
jgi:hypothetical protein